jgi:DNA-binding transcriptional regulator YhcF (GntR family)
VTQSGAPSNPFAVDPGDALPVGLQLGVRLRALIATGYLAAGEALPSVRRMAQLAGVNLSTVRVVYAHLEEHGLAISHHGQGTFVATEVKPAPELEEMATATLQGAFEAGLSPRDLADVVLACASIPGGLDSSENDGSGTSAEALEAEAIEVRDALRRQIARLEAELASYSRELSEDSQAAAPRTVVQLDSVEELEELRETLVAQLTEARLVAEQQIRTEARKRLLEESGRDNRESPGPLGRAMGQWRDEH